MVLKNRRLTIRDVADSLQISFGSVQAILKNDLGLRRVKSRLVPKTLNFFNKERRVNICETMLSIRNLDLRVRLRADYAIGTISKDFKSNNKIHLSI